MEVEIYNPQDRSSFAMNQDTKSGNSIIKITNLYKEAETFIVENKKKK